ncbi:hypothetical protein AVEN_158443-1, partial [Araneus ventricosus]
VLYETICKNLLINNLLIIFLHSGRTNALTQLGRPSFVHHEKENFRTGSIHDGLSVESGFEPEPTGPEAENLPLGHHGL